MEYEVRYKKVGAWFWRKLKRVKGDGIMGEVRCRVFVLFNETRVEVPMDGVVFHFSPERFIAEKKAAELQAGQPIATNDGIGKK